jgi:modification methylase
LIKREEIIGDCRLLLGNSSEIIPTLGLFDAVITSPPYNLGNTSGGGFPKLGHYSDGAKMSARGGQGKWSKASAVGGLSGGYGEHDDAMPHEAYVEWQKQIVSALWDRLTPSGAIFYNHKPRVLNGSLVTPFEYLPPLPIRQVVIWARAGGINFSPAFYVPTHEWVVVIAKEAFRLRDKGASGIGDVWYIPQEANDLHPAPFPIKLPLNILDTVPAQTVLDPFCGSGSTAIACIKKGRKFTGIELSPVFFERACERIRKAYAQPDMFIERAPEPKQEALL